MALSNAERQKLYRQRQKAAAERYLPSSDEEREELIADMRAVYGLAMCNVIRRFRDCQEPAIRYCAYDEQQVERAFAEIDAWLLEPGPSRKELEQIICEAAEQRVLDRCRSTLNAWRFEQVLLRRH